MTDFDLNGKIFEAVRETARELNVKAFVIGGYVRDLLLNKHSKDIDFVVEGDGIEFALKTAKKLNPKIKPVIYKRFGTAMFVYRGEQYDFVGMRKEVYEPDSRKPKVYPGTLKDDQYRRDFTINALAISLNDEDYGKLYDPFNGLEDLRKKLIRTPLDPEITFSEDPLRMMRAIRFATKLHFKIEEKTFQAIAKMKERIKIVSQERITDELNKIMMSDKPSTGFKMLYSTGLLEIIFPELYELSKVDTIDGISHKNNFLHSIQVLDKVAQKSDNLWLRWAALLHDIGKPKTKKFIDGAWTFYGHQVVGAKMIPKIFRRLRLPLDNKMKYVQKLIELHHRPTNLCEEGITDSAVRRLIFDAGEELDDLFILVESDITTKYHEKEQRFLENYKRLKQRIKEVEEKDFIRNWKPPIDGNLIMETFGIKPSKIVGEIKNAIKDAILDGQIENSFKAAYEMMLELGKQKGLTPVKPLSDEEIEKLNNTINKKQNEK